MKTQFFLLALMVVTSASAQSSSEYRSTLEYNIIRFAGKQGDTLVTMDFNTGERKSINGHEYITGTVFTRYVNNDTIKSRTNHYYRQDGGKIYYYSGKENDEEILLMDFDLNVGDEFLLPNGQMAKVVEKKDTVITYKNRKLTLKGLSNPSFREEWLEGMGSTTTGLLPPSVTEVVTDIVPFKVSFRGLLGLNSLSWPAVNNDFVKTDIIYSQQEIDPGSAPWTCEFIGDSLRLRGGYEQRVQDRNMFVAFVNHNDVYVNNYEVPGYVNRDCCKLLDVKFGGFKAGTYHIHFDIFYMWPIDWDYSNMTELYSKTFINATLECKGNTASFPDIQPDTRASTSPAIYDLTGRRLTAEPTRGVYIRDGKKVWKVKN